jgi:hypothetical protein
VQSLVVAEGGCGSIRVCAHKDGNSAQREAEAQKQTDDYLSEKAHRGIAMAVEQSDLLKLNAKVVQYLARHEARDKLCRCDANSLFTDVSCDHEWFIVVRMPCMCERASRQ